MAFKWLFLVGMANLLTIYGWQKQETHSRAEPSLVIFIFYVSSQDLHLYEGLIGQLMCSLITIMKEQIVTQQNKLISDQQ